MSDTAPGCHLIVFLILAALTVAALVVQYEEDPNSLVPRFEEFPESVAAPDEGRADETPVPSSQLAGNALLLHDANVAFVSPGNSWTWRSTRPVSFEWSVLGHGLGAFRCSRSNEQEFTVHTFDYDFDHLDDATMEEVRKGLAARGSWKISYKPFDVPLPGSYRVNYDRHGPERLGPDEHCSALLAATGKLVVVRTCTEADQEPSDLPWYGRGLKLLHPVPKLPPFNPNPLNYVLLLLVIVGIAMAINKAKGAPVVDGWAIAALVIICIAAFKVFSVLHAEEFRIISPPLAAKFTFRTFLPALLPILVGFYASSRLRAQRSQGLAAPPSSARR